MTLPDKDSPAWPIVRVLVVATTLLAMLSLTYHSALELKDMRTLIAVGGSQVLIELLKRMLV